MIRYTDQRCDGFLGNKQPAGRQREAQQAGDVQHAAELPLLKKGKIAVSGAETARQARGREFGRKIGAGIITDVFNGGAGQRVEDERVRHIQALSPADQEIRLGAQGYGQENDPITAAEMGTDIPALRMKSGSAEASVFLQGKQTPEQPGADRPKQQIPAPFQILKQGGIRRAADAHIPQRLLRGNIGQPGLHMSLLNRGADSGGADDFPIQYIIKTGKGSASTGEKQKAGLFPDSADWIKQAEHAIITRAERISE